MRMLGIDPGPDNYAWAIFDTTAGKVVAWGDGDTAEHFDHVGIEDLQSYGFAVGKSTLDTAKMIGRLSMQYPGALLFSRKKIAAVITGLATSGDTQVNRALGRFVPSFAAKRKGLNGHHRSAAAVAFVAVGSVALKAYAARSKRKKEITT